MNFFKSNFWYFLLGQITVLAVAGVLGTMFVSADNRERLATQQFRYQTNQRLEALEKAIKQVDVIKKKVDQPRVLTR